MRLRFSYVFLSIKTHGGPAFLSCLVYTDNRGLRDVFASQPWPGLTLRPNRLNVPCRALPRRRRDMVMPETQYAPAILVYCTGDIPAFELDKPGKDVHAVLPTPWIRETISG